MTSRGADPLVQKALAAWARKRDAHQLKSMVQRMGVEQQRVLLDRLAELSLGLLAIIEEDSG